MANTIGVPPGPRLEQTRPTGHGRARGLVSSRESGRRVHAQTFAPPAEHADVVMSLWVGRWDLRAQTPHVTQLLSDPCAHIVFERGGGATPPASRLVGVWTRLWERQLSGEGLVRGVKLHAGALRAFIDAPAHRFTNRIVPLRELFDGDLEDLEQTALAADDDAGFGAIVRWLSEHRRRADEVDVRFAVALARRIVDDPAITSVERLATVAGVGPRALQRLFREHVGAPPKWVIRRNRLQEAALRIERGDGPTLAAIAADLGYADHAHLARDFKRAVGKSPSELASTR